jgi:hypothetical protein
MSEGKTLLRPQKTGISIAWREPKIKNFFGPVVPGMCFAPVAAGVFSCSQERSKMSRQLSVLSAREALAAN